MNTVNFKLNGAELSTAAGKTILEAAAEAGVKIPTLCFLKGINETSACGMCIVEVSGAGGPLRACSTRVTEGMDICTASPGILEKRKRILQRLASSHRFECEYCSRYSDCEFHELLRDCGVDERSPLFGESRRREDCAAAAVHIVRDSSKCLRCRRCEGACAVVRQSSTTTAAAPGRGGGTRTAPSLPLDGSQCIHCGQCLAACPTGALGVKDDTRAVWRAISDKNTLVCALLSPEVGKQIAESFFEPMGTDSSGKLVSMMRKIGFDRVYLAEPAQAQAAEMRAVCELPDRSALPVISAECPAALRYCREFFPRLAPHLSRGESARELFARRCREAFPEENLFIVNVDTCTAAKGLAGAEASITLPELSAMLRRACVSRYTAMQVWRGETEAGFDSLPASNSGAHKPVTLRTLTLTSMREYKALLESLQKGESLPYDYIRAFVCPGGCANGGGSVHVSANIRNFSDLVSLRRGDK